MTPSTEGWPSNAKEGPSPYEVRLTLLGSNTIFQYSTSGELSSKLVDEAKNKVFQLHINAIMMGISQKSF